MLKSLVIVFSFLFILGFTNVLAADRFVIGTGDANNTVIDTTTGLMWERSPNLHSQTWSNAVSYCVGLTGSDGRGEYGGWRLPTVNELLTLIDWRFKNPAVPNNSNEGQWSKGNPFLGINTILPAWAITNAAGVSDMVWTVYFTDGSVDSSHASYSDGWAWCVRGTMNNFSSSFSEEKIVYVNNTVYLNNCSDTAESLDCSDYINSSQKIIYLNKTVNNTVYVNNCTSKNVTCENKSSEKSLDYKTGIVIFSAMGLVIIGLIVSFIFYIYRHSSGE